PALVENGHPACKRILDPPVSELAAVLPEGDSIREAPQGGADDVSDGCGAVQLAHLLPPAGILIRRGLIGVFRHAAKSPSHQAPGHDADPAPGGARMSPSGLRSDLWQPQPTSSTRRTARD